jgi:DNA-binding beta-propeller fold protein YncE
MSGNPTGIVFDSSGTKMFIVDKHSDMVYQYVVNEPWRAIAINSTAGDSSHCYCNPISFSISGQEATPEGITFDASGTKMFVVGEASDTSNKGEVNAYDLSEPFDIASASHADVYTMSFTDTAPTGIVFAASGTKMFISDSGTNTIRQYNLNESYRITSNSTGDANTPSINVNSVDNTVRDVWFDCPRINIFVPEASNQTSRTVLSTLFTLIEGVLASPVLLDVIRYDSFRLY